MPDRVSLTPARQAAYHLGCFARNQWRSVIHLWRAFVAFSPVLFLLGMLLGLALIVLSLTGCKTIKPVISDAPPSQKPAESIIAAAVTQARADNAKSPTSPIRDAIEIMLKIAASGLPMPTPSDLARMADLSELVFAGNLPEAHAQASTYERELATLREQIASERAQSAAALKTLIENHQRELDHAAYMAVVWTFCAIGGASTAVGLGMLVWTTYKRIGIILLILGPIIGGSGLLWGSLWFKLGIALAAVLIGTAAGLKWAVSVFDKNQNGKLDFMETTSDSA
jgi:hypothetical protein